MDDKGPPTNQTRLDGWKAIAEYLGKSVRTVQRYERELSLPVRRVRTSDTGQFIYADRRELDEWLAKQSSLDLADEAPQSTNDNGTTTTITADVPPVQPESRPKPRSNRWIGGSVATLILALTAACWLGFTEDDPVDRSATSNAMPATDAISKPRRTGPELVYAVDGSRIIVIDGASSELKRAIRIPPDAPYTALGPATQSPDGRLLVIPTTQSDGVVLFDVPTETFRDWIEVPGMTVRRARLTNDGRRLVAITKFGPVVVFEFPSGSQVGTFSVPREAFDGLPLWDVNRFLVLSRDKGALFIADLNHLKIELSLATAHGAHDIVATADQRRGFITNEYDGSVSCVDLDRLHVEKTLKVGTTPISVAIAPDQRTVFVSNRDAGSIVFLDAASCSVRATAHNVVGGSRSWAVGVSTDSSRLYVADHDQPLVGVFDIRNDTLEPVATIRIANRAESFHAVQTK